MQLGNYFGLLRKKYCVMFVPRKCSYWCSAGTTVMQKNSCRKFLCATDVLCNKENHPQTIHTCVCDHFDPCNAAERRHIPPLYLATCAGFAISHLSLVSLILSQCHSLMLEREIASGVVWPTFHAKVSGPCLIVDL